MLLQRLKTGADWTYLSKRHAPMTARSKRHFWSDFRMCSRASAAEEHSVALKPLFFNSVAVSSLFTSSSSTTRM